MLIILLISFFLNKHKTLVEPRCLSRNFILALFISPSLAKNIYEVLCLWFWFFFFFETVRFCSILCHTGNTGIQIPPLCSSLKLQSVQVILFNAVSNDPKRLLCSSTNTLICTKFWRLQDDDRR